MDQVVRDAVAAIELRDWELLKGLLHPYLHWTEGGVTIRGRTKVLTHLMGAPPSGPPDSYELRDGQIYRWTTGN
ncbi:nuclear transport factor 2 family protein [Lentzea sp. PSKA42]|uniref:Nuclear transport factor 2 family protein n=1 Tax=Lentzea indica TaxID=2604800 RepID=A0ABX1FXT3_9PSEU|nr:nuclear transport factor 2 family protein [Lentzea indica]NKE63371.1 nuclear transport factor 2 family protein [Lentzea indica]